MLNEHSIYGDSPHRPVSGAPRALLEPADRLPRVSWLDSIRSYFIGVVVRVILVLVAVVLTMASWEGHDERALRSRVEI